ncbi:MAG: aminoacyl-tRNA hydrolase [Alphaproteobacteria bacterium]
MTSFLLIGLGNPGTRYAHNRHNIGFMAVDAIAKKHSFSTWSQKFQGQCSEGKIGGHRVFLLKPQTFMNLSGESAGALARFYKIPLENIIVLHDELDLPLAKVRVKLGGGNGGHNGLKSLDAHLGADYWRVRMGIGHPGDKDLVSPYVLSDFTKEEMPAVEKLCTSVAMHIDQQLARNDAEFMNKITLDMKD